MSGCQSCSGRLFLPQRWPGGGKTAVTELVARSPDQALWSSFKSIALVFKEKEPAQISVEQKERKNKGQTEHWQ